MPGYGPAQAPVVTYRTSPPDDPRAVVALILGILGVVLCWIAAPFALVIGRSSLKEIDASAGGRGGRGMALAGYILGIIGTVILGLGILGFVIAIIAAAATSGS